MPTGMSKVTAYDPNGKTARGEYAIA